MKIKVIIETMMTKTKLNWRLKMKTQLTKPRKIYGSIKQPKNNKKYECKTIKDKDSLVKYETFLKKQKEHLKKKSESDFQKHKEFFKQISKPVNDYDIYMVEPNLDEVA